MSDLLKNRVRETTTTTGNGLTLALSAVAGRQRFSAKFTVGQLAKYTLEDENGTAWEHGTGTVQAGNTIDRSPGYPTDPNFESTNGGARIVLTAGTHQIFHGPDAATFDDIYTSIAAKQDALGFTPYNATNPAGYLSAISGAMVAAALGFVPMDADAFVPPGLDKQLIFNDNGAWGADAGLTFDKAMGALSVGVGLASISGGTQNNSFGNPVNMLLLKSSNSVVGPQLAVWADPAALGSVEIRPISVTGHQPSLNFYPGDDGAGVGGLLQFFSHDNTAFMSIGADSGMSDINAQVPGGVGVRGGAVLDLNGGTTGFALNRFFLGYGYVDSEDPTTQQRRHMIGEFLDAANAPNGSISIGMSPEPEMNISAGAVKVSVLSASQVVLTDASKNLVSGGALGSAAFTASSAYDAAGLAAAALASALAADYVSPLTTKGDLLGFSTVNGRLGVGTDGFVLTADNASTFGFKWAAAAGGSGSPGGADTCVQFNDGSAFGGVATFFYNKTTKLLTLSDNTTGDFQYQLEIINSHASGRAQIRLYGDGVYRTEWAMESSTSTDPNTASLYTTGPGGLALQADAGPVFITLAAFPGTKHVEWTIASGQVMSTGMNLTMAGLFNNTVSANSLHATAKLINSSTGSAASTSLQIGNSNSDHFYIQKLSTGYTTAGIAVANQAFMYCHTTAGIGVLADAGPIVFAASGAAATLTLTSALITVAPAAKITMGGDGSLGLVQTVSVNNLYGNATFANTSTGNAALSSVQLQNSNGNHFYLCKVGTGYSSSGVEVADAGFLYCHTTAGIAIAADAGPITFAAGSLTEKLRIASTALTFAEAYNIIAGTTTGTKIGTATSQKFGIWNATPIVQPTTAIAASTLTSNTSLIANDTATWDGYTIGQVVKALRNFGVLA